MSVSCLYEADISVCFGQLIILFLFVHLCTVLILTGSHVLVNREEGRQLSPSHLIGETGDTGGHFLSHQVSGLTVGIKCVTGVLHSLQT